MSGSRMAEAMRRRHTSADAIKTRRQGGANAESCRVRTGVEDVDAIIGTGQWRTDQHDSDGQQGGRSQPIAVAGRSSPSWLALSMLKFASWVTAGYWRCGCITGAS